MLTLYKWGRVPIIVAIVAINAYTIASPWLPALRYKINPPTKHFSLPSGVPIAPATGNITQQPATNQPNGLFIPSIGLAEIIYEGNSVSTLNKGVWHRPFSSSPVLGGNTVLAGHRFSYKWRPVFYNLDKVKVGDDMIVDWHNQRYEYRVVAIRIVKPYDISVEQPTEKETLTVYTCTPLVSFTQRLVVIAERLTGGQ